MCDILDLVETNYANVRIYNSLMQKTCTLFYGFKAFVTCTILEMQAVLTHFRCT